MLDETPPQAPEILEDPSQMYCLYEDYVVFDRAGLLDDTHKTQLPTGMTLESIRAHFGTCLRCSWVREQINALDT